MENVLCVWIRKSKMRKTLRMVGEFRLDKRESMYWIIVA